MVISNIGALEVSQVVLDDVRLVLSGHSGRDVVPADIEGLGNERSLQSGVDIFGDLIDEEGGDGVDLQQVRSQIGV